MWKEDEQNHDHLHLGQAQRMLDAYTSQERTP